MAGKISYKIDEPDIFHIDGVGTVEYYEFEENIWIRHCCAEKRGMGNRLAREFIEFAVSRGKHIHGQANPQGGMGIERLMKWYRHLGAKHIYMKGHPTAMKLEISK